MELLNYLDRIAVMSRQVNKSVRGWSQRSRCYGKKKEKQCREIRQFDMGVSRCSLDAVEQTKR